MQRYFIHEECIDNDIITIDPYNHKHMQRVLRYQNGDQVICVLPSLKTYIYEIVDIGKGILKVVEECIENNELDIDITLVYGLPKHDKFEWVLQKATELGVKRIVPLLSQRTIVKTDAATFSKKYERYQRILKEASEQSCRQVIPELTQLIKIDEVKDYLSDINLVAYEEASKAGEHTAFDRALKEDYQTITVIVGPEGGFDQSEINTLEKWGVKPCALGKRILRSETAPLYMLSVLGYSRELKI